MPRFKLLKTSTAGPKGAVVEVPQTNVEILRQNGVIAEPTREPEVKKVAEAPKVKKRARNTAD